MTVSPVGAGDFLLTRNGNYHAWTIPLPTYSSTIGFRWSEARETMTRKGAFARQLQVEQEESRRREGSLAEDVRRSHLHEAIGCAARKTHAYFRGTELGSKYPIGPIYLFLVQGMSGWNASITNSLSPTESVLDWGS